jgi:hypothetical protein
MHNVRHAIAKAVANICQTRLASLVLGRERVFFRSFPETTPYSCAGFWFTQVAKNRARVVNFIRQRNQAGLSVNRFQMLDAGITANWQMPFKICCQANLPKS